MRRLSVVLDAMIVHCPLVGHPLRDKLLDLKNSLNFVAPEVEHLHWGKLLDLMMEFIAPEVPDDIEALLAMEDWKKNVLMEFNPETRKLFKD